MRHLPIVLATLLCTLGCKPGSGSSVVAADEGEPPATRTDTAYKDLDVAVPMRDGVVLKADVWRPAKDGRFPTLVYRSPYGKTEEFAYNERTIRAAVARGYAVVVNDVRGRYTSGGDFSPYLNERKDGYDVIEWAAAQPWSTGEIGMFGLSYPGASQWLAAMEQPPHLKAIVPAMSIMSMRHFIYYGGVFEADWTWWIYNLMSYDVRVKKNLPGPKTYDEAKAEYARLGDEHWGPLPLSAVEDFKDVGPYYYEWLKHPAEDAFWDFGEVRAHWGDVKAAVLNLSGWHDEGYGPIGAVTNFAGLSKVRQGDARTRLLIGPWVHGAFETEDNTAGDLTFGENAKIDYDAVVLGFLDEHVRGLANPAAFPKPVRVYVMGDDKWRDADAWPLPGTKFTDMYLVPGSSAQKGALAFQAPAKAQTTSFTADPTKPVKDLPGTAGGAFDLGYLAERDDVLSFETGPLEADLEVTGPITAELYMATDQVDFDVHVKLLDVHPDGKAFNTMSPGSDVLRASYRDGLKPTPVPRNKPVKLVLPNLLTGNTFKKGHRIRVVLAASWFPVFARNLQSGESEMTSGRAVTAKLTLHQGPGKASKLILPVQPR